MTENIAYFNKKNDAYDDLDLLLAEERINASDNDIDDFILFGRDKPLSKDSSGLHANAEHQVKIVKIEDSLFLFIYIGLCILLLISGIFLMQNLYKNNGITDAPQLRSFLRQENPGVDELIKESSGLHANNDLDTQKVILRNKLENYPLEPFLILAQQSSGPVFLRLNIELLIKDMNMKDKIFKKEAWIRDSIYNSLKGMDLPDNFDNLYLQKNKNLLISGINKEIAPLKVEDIRLKGNLLK